MPITLAEIKRTIGPEPWRQRTLCYLVRPGEIMLAMKKRGFGAGKWNGLGGKVESNETVEEAARREVLEESSVILKDLTKRAEIDVLWRDEPEKDQRLHIFFADNWLGSPIETEEMAPEWFKNHMLPHDAMWPSDREWLPMLIAERQLYGRILFGENRVLESDYRDRGSQRFGI